MARNEIKLRKRIVDEGALQRHRNYGLLLQRHQHEQRRKKTRQVFIYTLLIAVVTILVLIVISYFMVKWEKNRELKRNGKTAQVQHDVQKPK